MSLSIMALLYSQLINKLQALFPLATLHAGTDCSVECNRVRFHLSLPHRSHKMQCLLPLAPLITGAEWTVACDPDRFEVSLPHLTWKLQGLLLFAALPAGADCTVRGTVFQTSSGLKESAAASRNTATNLALLCSHNCDARCGHVSFDRSQFEGFPNVGIPDSEAATGASEETYGIAAALQSTHCSSHHKLDGCQQMLYDIFARAEIDF